MQTLVLLLVAGGLLCGRVVYVNAAIGTACAADGDCDAGNNEVCDTAVTNQCVCNTGFTDNSGTCEPDCPSLTDPADGSITYSALQAFSSVATYACDSGYDVTGTPTRTCGAGGTWGGSAATCTIKDCGSLTDPTDGSITFSSGTTFGSAATYSCNSGYDISTATTRNCQADGTWEATAAPTCTIKDCGAAPAAPSDGSRVSTTTTFGSTAVYSCNTGFTIFGTATISCQADGTWATPPTCVVVTCSALTLTNGAVTYSDTQNVNSVATHTCDSGFTLSGTATRTCGAAGLWDGSTLTCNGADRTVKSIGLSLASLSIVLLLILVIFILFQRLNRKNPLI